MTNTETVPVKTGQKPAAKRKMRPGAGKAKGNSFENQIAKKLTAALDPLKFIRTQGSGARVGGKNFETIGQMFGEDALKLFVGDVVPVNEKDSGLVFQYSIECKAYASADTFPSLVSGNANVFKWFDESVTDARKINKKPMLICKWNHTPIFVIIGKEENPGIIAALPPTIQFLCLSNKDQRQLLVFFLDDLLTYPDIWVTP